MQIVSVVNHKGGAAKTTTAVNLSAALRQEGRKVLLVDLDPQASATLWLGKRDKGADLLEALMQNGELQGLITETASGVDLVPAGPALASFEKLGARQKDVETFLRRGLEQLPRKWDHVFLDCPPSLNLMSVSAMVACDRALVPVMAQVLSLEPLARLLDTMWNIRERFNDRIQLSGIFASRVDTRTAHSGEVLELLRQQFGDNVFKVHIRECVQLAEAAGFQKPITEYAPSSNGAKDYRALAKEFEKRLETELAEEKA